MFFAIKSASLALSWRRNPLCRRGLFAVLMLLPGAAQALSDIAKPFNDAKVATTKPETATAATHKTPLQVLAPTLVLHQGTTAATSQTNPTQTFRQWQQHNQSLFRQTLLLPAASAADIAAASAVGSTPDRQLTQWQLPLWQPLDVYLYQPEVIRQGAINAVILLHDHGAEFRIGKDKWLPPELTAQPALVEHWQQKYFDGVAIAELLRQAGYLVLLADAPGFGERGPIQYAEQQQLAANLQAQGFSLAGLMAREDEAAAAFLAKQPGVRGVAAIGFSMGGFRAWQLAALSNVVKAAVSVSWFNSLQFLRDPANNFSRGQSSFYFLHPGLYQSLDFPDLAALAAPKPLLFLHGDEDPLMPLSQVQLALQQLSQRYQQCRGTLPDFQVATGQGHRFGRDLQQQMLQWLATLQLPAGGCSN